MYSRALVAVLLAGGASAIDNGIGHLPPMGWRSWNCYGANVNQSLMEGVMDAMVKKRGGKSLLDLGYNNVGLDDNWQACKTGIDASFHGPEGKPLVNHDRFPSMSGMTAYGHAKGLKVGWYGNNCICAEHQKWSPEYIAKHMQQSAKAAADYGFDGIKLDGCGEFRNLTWWSKLLNETGRPIMIENCHWGQTVPGQTTGDAPCTGLGGDVSNCPYNFFRSSGDIRAEWTSVVSNLMTTVKFLGNPPLSRPGTWAYPDMLEVGRLANYAEDRSHFAAWAIVSSPLVLGLDVTDAAGVEKVWDIISNEEILGVSQTWAGHPGRLVSNTNGVMIWSKPLSAKEHAVLVINNHGSTVSSATIDLASIGLTGTVNVRDIYAHKDLAQATGTIKTDSIGDHDSVFYKLTQA